MFCPSGGEARNPATNLGFLAGATVERTIPPLVWKTNEPVWVDQWSLTKDKLEALQLLADKKLSKGHNIPSTSPWNTPGFVIKKPGKDKWRLLQDLCKINISWKIWVLYSQVSPHPPCSPGTGNSQSWIPRTVSLTFRSIPGMLPDLPFQSYQSTIKLPLEDINSVLNTGNENFLCCAKCLLPESYH